MYLSVIVPAYNERACIAELCNKLNNNLPENKECEIIFVDDGSSDDSYHQMLKMGKQYSNVRVVKLRKNFGKSTALSCGFSVASGDILVTIDADLQDDPGEIYKLIEKYDEGYDVVSGWRQKREDSMLRVIGSKVFNFLVSKMSGLKLHDFNCGLKLYRKDVYKTILLYGEQHRLLPMIAYMMGFKVTEVHVIHHSRKYGHSKYRAFRFHGLFDLISVFFIYSFQKKPFHVFGLFALILFFIGIFIFVILVTKHFIYMISGDMTYILQNRPLLVMSLVLMVLAVQIAFSGLIAELLVNAFHRINKDDSNIIEEVKSDQR